MATLTSPVAPQNIVDRFADFVVNTANSGILWGTNNNPTHSDGTVVLDDTFFGGTTSGKSIGISGSNISGNPIDAATIYNTLVGELNTYTRIRNVRAQLNVTGGGGNTGTRPSAGIIFDETAVGNMSSLYLQTIPGQPNGPSPAGVIAGLAIDDDGLESFFTNLRNSYNGARANTVTITTNVCHASCHSSCHGSRGRR